MKTKLLIFAGLAGCALAWAASDPVVMTVGGRDVKKSEFEYLYHKNSAQQLQAQPLDQYVEMFQTYKRKVADARAAGIDTTESFRQEFEQYRNELAAPYLVDSVYIKKLAREAYDRFGQEVHVAHIMIFKPQYQGPTNAKEKADSIYGAFKAGGDFEQLARSYSQDQRSAVNGGDMAWITSMQYPYSFESAAYALKDGQVSGVVESPFGYHIIKRLGSRPASGTVEASHILILVPQGATAEQEEAIKAQMDSIYNAAINGADFAQLAKQYSQDPGSAANGGALGSFGRGRMVPEFENTAFDLSVGEISKPFRTSYGYHIIKKTGAKGLESYQTLEPLIIRRITDGRDERVKLIKEQRVAGLSKQYKLKENQPVISELTEYIQANGMTPQFSEKYGNDNRTLFTYGKNKTAVPVSALAPMMARGMTNPLPPVDVLGMKILDLKNKVLLEEEMANLEQKNPEYRNLVNEYRDGILLFEISNRKVWDRAVKDTEGLEKYFEAHRTDYKWEQPHVKGYLIQAANDSVRDAVMARLPQINPDSLQFTIRKEFGKDIKMDRVLAAQGENNLIDNLIFGGPEVKPSDSRYTTYFMWDAVMLDAPSAVEDVRGQVTSDYQNELENAWVEELRLKYPATVNEKVLKKVKP